MRILLAVDGSASADRARELIASLTWPPATHVRVIAALDVGPALWGGPWIPAVPVDADAYEAEAAAYLSGVLDGAETRLKAAGLEVETELMRGLPHAAIVEDARLWQPDLMVVGSRGHGPVETALLGSVSSAVVDHAAWPVLVARSDHVDRVILAEDGSPAGIAARDVIAGWPAFAALPTLVVGVIDVAAPWRSGIAPNMFASAMDVYSELIASSRGTYRQVIDATAAALRAAGRQAETELREGDPADQIIEVAHHEAGDLIVIGTRGYTGVTRLVMGSVAHRVLTHAHASVLIVHGPRQKA